ncbi:MAG: Smr/MutS family protein, partial [Anaeromyxobacteraceae bacterium]
EVARVLAELQAQPSMKKAADTQRQLEEWRETVRRGAQGAQARAETAQEALPGGAIAAGARVRVVSLGKEGEVLECNGDEALLRIGSLKIRRPVEDLIGLQGKARAAPAMARSRSEKLAAAEAAAGATGPVLHSRLDVRGLRVDELLREVGRFLDRLYQEGEAECLILHGHGTGALKQALRDHLAASPYVGSFRRGEDHEGGDAVTLVSIRR